MGKTIGRGEEDPLCQKIGIKGESYKRLQQKYNHHHNSKTIHHHTHTQLYHVNIMI